LHPQSDSYQVISISYMINIVQLAVGTCISQTFDTFSTGLNL
jgi:hypothetical protein